MGSLPAREVASDSQNGDPRAELAQLRELLVGPEQEKLRALQKRLDDPALRTEELSQLVAEAIAIRARRDHSLQRPLQPIVEDALRISVARNPAILANSLYPIIGEAVRKSVAHALREMTETLNQVLERSFSLESLKWRVEALRSGRSFGEIALMRSFRYRVEEIFLIHRETGLLLQHVARDKPLRCCSSATTWRWCGTCARTSRCCAGAGSSSGPDATSCSPIRAIRTLARCWRRCRSHARIPAHRDRAAERRAGSIERSVARSVVASTRSMHAPDRLNSCPARVLDRHAGTVAGNRRPRLEPRARRPLGHAGAGRLRRRGHQDRETGHAATTPGSGGRRGSRTPSRPRHGRVGLLPVDQSRQEVRGDRPGAPRRAGSRPASWREAPTSSSRTSRSAVSPKYGLAYADIEAINPRAIYLSISAFGQDGPDAAGPGYDAAIQGMGGLMSLTGVPEGEPGAGPQKVGVAVADLMCGMYAVASVLAALVRAAAVGSRASTSISRCSTRRWPGSPTRT